MAIRCAGGATGLGEAAPLPGLSLESIEDCERELAAVAPGTLPRAAAARFAVETALRVARAQAGERVWAEPRALACAAVVDDAADARVTTARTLKIKVGAAPFDDDLARVERIAHAAPRAWLRLDANGLWPRDEVRGRLRALAARALPIEFVEEPCPNAHELVEDGLAVPIALDESLARIAPDDLARALRSPQLAALVLKPTVLGGFSRCLELADAARAHGIAPITSHALEGRIGMAACVELARMIGADVDVGLEAAYR
ncbi:MAG TPA: enolase C-terminal domain-like protein [Kofleriaceae bacterium]|nr:enolase C-terminal domain-like protein [Kofleriaceae bacterium]